MVSGFNLEIARRLDPFVYLMLDDCLYILDPASIHLRGLLSIVPPLFQLSFDQTSISPWHYAHQQSLSLLLLVAHNNEYLAMQAGNGKFPRRALRSDSSEVGT